MRAPLCNHSPSPNSGRSWSKPAKKKRQTGRERNAFIQGSKLHADPQRREGSRDETRRNHQVGLPAQTGSHPSARTTEERLFPDWTTGLRDLADDRIANTPGYNDFMNTLLTDSEFSRAPNRSTKLLLRFKKNT